MSDTYTTLTREIEMRTYGPVGHQPEDVIGTPAQRLARVEAFSKQVLHDLKYGAPVYTGADLVIIHDIYQETAAVSTEYKGRPSTFGPQVSHDDAETCILNMLERSPDATIVTNDYRKQ
jgi:hypothetical protein